MKNTVKWLCIIAGMLIAAGIVIFAIGKVFNGQISTEIFGIYSGITVTEEDIIKETKEISPFEELQIEATLTDIYILKGDKYELEISAPEELIPEVKEQSGKLIVKQPKIGNVNVINASVYYKLTVPSDEVIKTDITVTSGDISIESVNVEGHVAQTSGDAKVTDIASANLKLDSTSGNAVMNSCEIDEISMDHTSGAVNLNDTTSKKIIFNSTSGDLIANNAVTDEFNANITSGEIEATDCDFKNVYISGTSADVNLDLRGNVSDYDYAINTLSGDIEVDTMEMEHTYVTKNGKNNKITIDTTSGDIKIAF